MSGQDPRGKRVEKLQIMVADEELERIDDWRFENRSPSRSAAIRTLILLGMQYSGTHRSEASAFLKESDAD